MSNPRYVPRDYARHPRDFGRNPRIEWMPDDVNWTKRQIAQRDAAQLQHQVAFGVLERYMPSSATTKMTTLAEALEIPYERLQKILTGRAVMQLEDLGRLRGLIGEEFDAWLVRGRQAALAKQAADVARVLIDGDVNAWLQPGQHAAVMMRLTQLVRLRDEQERVRGMRPMR